jgi:hypothetical protein
MGGASLPLRFFRLWQHSPVPEMPSAAVLASIAATLDDLKTRVVETAGACAEAGDESKAAELYEVERSLLQASRRMTRLLRP